ncbi:MAG: hypothetical protein ABIZ72_03175 [Candidatus Limnocylindrales bacterium]
MDQTLLASLGLVALAVGVMFTLYDMRLALKPSTCRDCPHCRAIAVSHIREQDARNRDHARRVGLLDDDEDDRRVD